MARALADPIPSMPPVPPAPARWGDLRLRIVSASILAPMVLGCAWFGGAAWVLLVCIAGWGVAAEWVALCGGRLWTATGLGVAGPVLVGCLATAGGVLTLGALALTAGAIATRRVLFGAGVLYAGVAGIALIWLRDDPEVGQANIFFLISAVVASDICAYAVGRVVGGPRLAPLISPGKTWSGAFGGLVGAAVAGSAVAAIMGGGNLVLAAVLALFLAAVAQGGDLFESWFKRRSGVKDSGSMIPGHGGVMDRLDGFLFAGPVAALMAAIVGRGAVLWH